jgi:hypothetical protein
MRRVEVYKKMALLGALLQIAVEKIDEIENIQPLFKGVLKSILNKGRKEIDKVLNRLFSAENQQAFDEGLLLTTRLEEAFNNVYKEVYKTDVND